MRIRYKVQPVILLFVCLIFFSGVTFAQNIDAVTAKRDPATNLSIEQEKAEIYPKLRDKRCSTMSLDKCDCPDAREMRAYIEALIETGASKDEIFYRVARKFTLNTILDKQIKQDVEKRLIHEAGEKRPQIILDSTSFDFGTVSKKKGKVSKAFKVSNKGNLPLFIKQIKTSCPCATVSLKVGKNKSPYFGTEGSPKDWQAKIKQGESGELELIVDLASPQVKPGKLIRDATITSNDPLYPETTVRVEAEVID